MSARLSEKEKDFVGMNYYEENLFDIVYDDEFINVEVFSNVSDSVTPKEAFVLSINHFGRVNLDYMSEVSGLEKDALIESLEGVLIWKDPHCYDVRCTYKSTDHKDRHYRQRTASRRSARSAGFKRKTH